MGASLRETGSREPSPKTVSAASGFDPARCLRASAAIFRRLGQIESANFTQRMSESATLHPQLYAHWASEQAKRAQRELSKQSTREGGLAKAPASNQ